jgi:hypothetical protein
MSNDLFYAKIRELLTGEKGQIGAAR